MLKGVRLMTLLIVAATCSILRVAQADTVYMADGRVLHGKVTETADGIELTTRIGVITFPSNAVSSWQQDDTDSAAPTPIKPEAPATQISPATEPTGSTTPGSPTPTKTSKKKNKVAKAGAATQPAVAAASAPASVAAGPATQPATQPAVAAVVESGAATQPAVATSERSIPDAKRKFEPDIRALLASRWNDLDNLVVTADEQATGADAGNWHVLFRFFGDRAYLERTPVAGSAADRLITVLLPDKVILVNAKGVTLQKPSIDNYKLDGDLDIAFGYRAPLDITWLTPDQLDTWKMKFPSVDAATISSSITPSGEKKAVRTIAYSRPMEYAISDVQVMRKGAVLGHVTCDGFQNVGTWMLPNHIVVETFGDDGQSLRKVEIDVKSFQLNDAKNTPDTYSDFWPAGTPVNDQTAAQPTSN
jgi:hypothetical protein